MVLTVKSFSFSDRAYRIGNIDTCKVSGPLQWGNFWKLKLELDRIFIINELIVFARPFKCIISATRKLYCFI